MYVKNHVSFTKRMNALERAISAVTWGEKSMLRGERYFALRMAQNRLTVWGLEN